MFVEISMLFGSNWYYCLTAELNQIKTAILIKMTSRSGGCISGRTKLFLRGLKTKQLLSKLVPAKFSDLSHHAVGHGSGPSTWVCFSFFVPLVNPPHWCLKMRIAILTGNVTISHVDLGCTHVQTNPCCPC